MLNKFLNIVFVFIFTSSLYSTESSELENWQKIPKAELHLHLGGAYPKEYLFSIANEEQKQKLENALFNVSNRVNYHDVFQVFQVVSQIVTTEESVQNGVEALCLSLKDDGVTYVEIRSGLKDLGGGNEGYLKAILNGIQAQNSDHFQANILLSLRRNSSLSAVKDTVDLALKYQHQGVIGIDISGDSTIGQIELILPDLLRAKKAGIPFVIHVGESPEENDQMQLLTILEPVRIGHGVHLSSEALDWMLSNRVPLEVCLSSSVLVQMIDERCNHPGIQLFKQGHPIVLCTDDPLIFSTTLSQELSLASKETLLSKEEIEKIANDSIQYRIIPKLTQESG